MSHNQHLIGSIKKMRGCVGVYMAVYGRTPSELEDILGFEKGRLNEAGYFIYFLQEKINNSNEFIWKGNTKNSNGWVWDDDCGEWIQISDAYRSNLVTAAPTSLNRYDHADMQYDKFTGEELKKLNIREGSDRIIKIVPAVKHTKESKYPDSSFSNIPQWDLTVKKDFRCVAYVARNQIWLGGACGVGRSLA